MKKIVCALLTALLLTAAAGAVTLHTDGVTDDAQAQANMLSELHLLRGTGDGFALDKTLTRAEAAVMIVRLLGAENEALANAAQHPFGDVPAWAASYVGYLYQNGLVKGVSESSFAPGQAVTCHQYAVMLSRATSGEDDSVSVASGEEAAACDKAGFLRADAVALSVRTLATLYKQEQPVAQYLIGRGVFTAKELGDAAFGVLQDQYPMDAGVITRETAHVETARCTETGLTLASYEAVDRLAVDLPLLAWRETAAGAEVLSLSPLNLTVDTIGTVEQKNMTQLNCAAKVGMSDYWAVETEGDVETLYRYFDQTEWRDTGVRFNGQTPIAAVEALVSGDRLLYRGKLFDEQQGGAVTNAKLPAQYTEVLLFDGTNAVTQDVRADGTTVAVTDVLTGQIVDTYELAMDVADVAENMLYYYGRSLTARDTYLYGEAGLYQYENGRLKQITDRSVIDFAVDASDGSIVFITHPQSERDWAQEGYPCGSQIAKITADGQWQTLLPEGMIEHIGFVKNAVGGAFDFRTIGREGMTGVYYNDYHMEDGRITVTKMDPGMFGDAAVQAEQKRLDDLGYGAPQAKYYVALTFDDGPTGNTGGLTERLLDGLKARDAHATFFVCGYRIKDFHTSLARCIAEGHELGNHTMDHVDLTRQSDGGKGQVAATDQLIQKYTGAVSTCMRPTGGAYNSTVRSAMAAAGKPVILWSVDTLDWKNRNAASVKSAILQNIDDGAIILMHDLYPTTVDGVLAALDELEGQGYAFVTVSELAKIKGVTLEPGKVYTSID